MRVQRKIVALLAALCGIISFSFVLSAPAEALACPANPTDGHDGYVYNPSAHPGYSFTGASSFIVVRQGANCTGVTAPGNFNNAYVMIASSSQTSYNGGWSQVGFEATSGHPLRWFSQSYEARSDTLETRYSSFSIASEVGVRHTFRAYYLLTCSCNEMIIDDTIWASSSFSPYSTWAQPFSPQYTGEAGEYESNIPGSTSAPTAYTGMGTYDYQGDNTLVPCVLSGVNSNPSRWAASYSGCTAISVWTK